MGSATAHSVRHSVHGTGKLSEVRHLRAGSKDSTDRPKERERGSGRREKWVASLQLSPRLTLKPDREPEGKLPRL